MHPRKSSKTSRIEALVASNPATLKEISEATGLGYRTVNAMVDGLERRFRLEADNYDLPRGQQKFRTIPADVGRKRRDAFEAAYKAIDPNRTRYPHPSKLTIISAVPESMRTMFGIRPASLPSFSGHRKIYTEDSNGRRRAFAPELLQV